MITIERVADLATNARDEDHLLEPIDRTPHDYAYWEQQIDAAVTLLRQKKLMTVDHLRQGIESIDPSVYNQLTYYERWAISIAKYCLESGVFESK